MCGKGRELGYACMLDVHNHCIYIVPSRSFSPSLRLSYNQNLEVLYFGLTTLLLED